MYVMDVDEQLQNHQVPHELKKKKIKKMKKNIDKIITKKIKKKKKIIPRDLNVLKGMTISVEQVKRYFFPNNPMKPWDEHNLSKQLDYPNTLEHVNHVTSLLGYSIRYECRKSKSYLTTNIKLGKHVDVESLLFPFRNGHLVRRDGSKLKDKSSLKGKYILVCSTYAPTCWSSGSEWKAVVTCSEIYSKSKADFEMVVVTRMRRGWIHDEDGFNQFFSAFPSSCLTVPFRAKSRRNRICRSLGGTGKVLLVAPDGKVLLYRKYDDCLDDLSLVPVYGEESCPFPFLSRNFVAEIDEHTGKSCIQPMITEAQQSLKTTTLSSLEDFLCCSTSDFVVRKIAKKSKGSEVIRFKKRKVSVLDLKKKVVGLYLYTTGQLLPLIRNIVEGCIKSDIELEIVMVYLPTECTYDPRYFHKVLRRVLATRNLSCWVAPYNHTASIVLQHLFQEEKVIMFGPNGMYVDTRGAEFMHLYGIYAYPFTFNCVVQKTVEDLRRVTLESFLKLLKIRPGDHTGKKVLFYYEDPHYTALDVYYSFRDYLNYENVHTFISNKEAYLINAENLKLKDSNPVKETPRFSWHSKDFFLKFFNRTFSTIVAFGEDGKICSVKAHLNPTRIIHPFSEVEINGNLLEEVSSILKEFFERYDRSKSRFDPKSHELQKILKARRKRFW